MCNRIQQRVRSAARRQPALPHSSLRALHSGFTLVEMLVSVGVVLIMMTLFATIFGLATNAMSTQKAIGENDQKVRLVLDRLRNDLNSKVNDPGDINRPRRTFLNLVPFLPDETTSNPVSTADRDGYFSISENSINDDTDDVLSMTVYMPSASSERFVGRAAIVFPDSAGNYGTPVPPGTPPTPGPNPYPPNAPTVPATANAPATGQAYWPNQPEFDDVSGNPTNSGASSVGEVCYFLRKGTLYRRFLLVRQPQVSLAAQSGNPTDTSGGALTASTYSNGNRNFYTDFDYSAYFLVGTGLQFHGTYYQTGSSMLNDSIGAALATPTTFNPISLSNPAYRFGFDCTSAPGAGSTYGQPREYVTSAGVTSFIGRFSQRETSNQLFGYPGNITSGNPMNMALTYNATTGTVTNFAPAPPSQPPTDTRAGEDVLMTNVLKFDIKVWDPAASVGPDGKPGIAGVDDDGRNGVDDQNELGWPGSDDGDFRDIGHNGTTGFYSSNPQNVPVTMKYAGILSTSTSLTGLTAYTYPNTIYSNPASGLNRYDTWNSGLDFNNDNIHDVPPFCPYWVGPDGVPGRVGDDDNDGNPDFLASGAIDTKELGWPGSDDMPMPLTAIQIKISFYDTTSKQLREVTSVFSLIKQ